MNHSETFILKEDRIAEDLCAGIRRLTHECEECIQTSPLGAVGAGMILGYLLGLRAFRIIVGAHVRLLLAAARPAISVYGATKLYELWQRRCPVSGTVSSAQTAADTISVM